MKKYVTFETSFSTSSTKGGGNRSGCFIRTKPFSSFGTTTIIITRFIAGCCPSANWRFSSTNTQGDGRRSNTNAVSDTICTDIQICQILSWYVPPRIIDNRSRLQQ